MSRQEDTSASPSFSALENEDPGASRSSSSPPPPSHVRYGEGEEYPDRDETEYHRFPHPQGERERDGDIFRGYLFGFDELSSVSDDSWSCLTVVLTFCFFVSLTLIFGVYGTVSLSIGPNSSVLFQPSPVFVQSFMAEQLNSTDPGLTVFGFYKSPPLDGVKTWSRARNLCIPADSYQDSMYYLNKGSQINISYHLNSSSSSVFLVIAEGYDGLYQWLQDPTYPNTTLSWNHIYGSGMVEQTVPKSSSYYVAVGNLNLEEINVKLTIRVRALLYNTTESYYKCTFSHGKCRLSILFPSGNTVLLTSSNPGNGSHYDHWNVKLSYGPRWATYIVGIAGMTVLMLTVFNSFKKFQYIPEERTTIQSGVYAPQRSPLLSQKDDDLSSWGSSYGSASDDEKACEDFLAAGSLERKPARNGENDNCARRLCAICFDAPRSCFFLPCGHCVTCFACGTRIMEAAGTCPICRRKIKKVRKIFTV